MGQGKGLQARGELLWDLPLAQIKPSPYQPRWLFDEAKLQQLADDIQANGLLQPIVCRPVDSHFELIAGERRWRAIQRIAGRTSIDARLVDVDDRQAQRMCYAENIQREDLTAVEQAEAVMFWLDSWLLDELEYAACGSTPIQRVAWILSKFNSDYNNGTDHVMHRFMHKVDAAFSQLPKKLDWRSYYVNDLPLVNKLDEEVKRLAVKEKLNKSQAKAMQEIKQKAPELFDQIVESRQVKVVDAETHQSERQELSEVSANDLKAALREHQAVELSQPPVIERKAPVFPSGRYGVLYADPPWSYDNSGFDQSAEQHYPTMPTDDICNLRDSAGRNIPDLCTKDTVLFLWATSPLLPEACRVMAAWGFEYRASLVWDKGRSPGIGWFVRTQHEMLLVGVREGNRHPAIKPKSVLRLKRAGHSEKPHAVCRLIQRMYSGPYCELFAREAYPGWEAWGNEVS